MEINDVKIISDKIIENISKVILGKEEVIKLIITAVLADGHVLIEDNPGTGKTMLAKSLAKSIKGDFKRVQFTPDLMPSDITGLNIFNQKSCDFNLMKGPVFTNILLADEINRATPRTQSALLEAMEERQVTIDGETMNLDKPFLVVATENSIEQSGTYPLPEAELDRFIMKLEMGKNEKNQELKIIERFIDHSPFDQLQPCCTGQEIMDMKETVKKVFVHNCVRAYLVDIVMATRDSLKSNGGVSTRGTLALLRCSQALAAIEGRTYVCPEDIKVLAPHVLGHRIALSFSSRKGGHNKELINEIVNSIQVPVEDWKK